MLWLQPVVLKIHLPLGFGDTTPIMANPVETNMEREIETWVLHRFGIAFSKESERRAQQLDVGILSDLPFVLLGPYWVYIGDILGFYSALLGLYWVHIGFILVHRKEPWALTDRSKLQLGLLRKSNKLPLNASYEPFSKLQYPP